MQELGNVASREICQSRLVEHRQEETNDDLKERNASSSMTKTNFRISDLEIDIITIRSPSLNLFKNLQSLSSIIHL
jgi:hypothetical protein